MASDLSAAQWRKSTRSSQHENSDCVELAAMDHQVAIRDSKDPNGHKITLTPTAFGTLVNRIKRHHNR